MIRKSEQRFSEKIMLDQKPRARGALWVIRKTAFFVRSAEASRAFELQSRQTRVQSVRCNQ